MKKVLLVTATVIVFTRPTLASYTECVALKETELVNRPRGRTDPRWPPLDKGNKVAIRDTYRDWAFVVHFVDDRDEYGWVPRSALTNCKTREGTP